MNEGYKNKYIIPFHFLRGVENDDARDENNDSDDSVIFLEWQ